MDFKDTQERYSTQQNGECKDRSQDLTSKNEEEGVAVTVGAFLSFNLILS